MFKSFYAARIPLEAPQLKGTARLADLWGSLNNRLFESSSDYNTIKKDWLVVGNDLALAIQQYRKENSHARRRK